MQEKHIFVTDIKLAAILLALGIPIRKAEPITCIVSTDNNGNRREAFSFWFDVTDDGLQEKAQEAVTAYAKARDWESFSLPTDHPLYWMKGVLENREVLLGWIRKNVKPLRVIQHGEKTILIGEKASNRLKSRMKTML